MKIFTRTFFILLLISSLVKAQDWHFSQFYYSPLTLNPALTGNMDGTYRVGLNYRNQWSSITSPFVYSTPSVWGDITVFRSKYSGNSLGMGLYIMDDKQGDGKLSTLNVMYSIAYQQTLDQAGNFHIAAGLQGGITQQSIDFTKLYFQNQFTGTGFNSDLASGEKLSPTQAEADIAAGASFSGLLSDYSRIEFGFAAFHLNRPSEFLLEKGSMPYYIRYSMDAQGTFGIDNKVYLFPAIMYEAQGPNSELIGGSAIGYNFSPSRRKVGTIFYVGGFYRNQDAVVATAGFILRGVQCGISYDINISSLQVASGSQGGFEVAIKYGNVVQRHHMKKQYCPRF